MSCDLLPDESGTDGWHYQGDVRDTIGEGWDLAVMHPPCTYLANAGVSWLHHDAERWSHLIDAASFFRWCLELPIPKVAVENPVMHGYGKRMVGAEPTQIVHPWQHGHAAQKATGLWLRGLPKLTPTDVVANARTWVETVPDIKDRWKIRSATYPGIAMAMAEQWGGVTVGL